MVLLQVVLFLMMCAVALGWVARHFKFPYPIALVIGGALLGFVPRLPQLQFDPQFLLVLVLPPILYQAALLTSWHEFKANIRPIGLLAIGLVIATTLAVGATLKLLIPDIPWAAAFVLGAIVSPPDVAAATAILSRVNIPRNVVTVLEGESLVNDASGLVIYKFAVAAVLTGAFSLWQASQEFVGVAVGGVVIGLLVGRVFVFIHRYLGDAFIEVLTTLAVPYVAYIFAESLHVSGVLAVVAAGIVRGRYSPEIVSAEMRIIARSVWNLLVFLLNTLIFILIGVQLSGIMARLTAYSVGRDWSLQEEQQRAQMALGKAAIAAIDTVAAKDGIPNELAERIRAEFAEKITLSVPGGLMLRHSGADDARRLRDAAVRAERQELIRLWRENQISDEVLHHIEEDLDYQESRI